MNPVLWKYLIFCFVGLMGPAAAQNIDSLEIALSGTDDLSVKATILNQMSEFHFNSDPAKSLDFAGKAAEMSKIAEDTRNLGISFYWLGRIYNTLNNPDTALDFFYSAQLLMDENTDSDYYGLVILFTGQSLKQLFRFDEALQKFQEAAELFKQNNDRQNQAGAYNQIGGLYYDMGDLDRAFEYFTKTLSVMQKLGHEPGLSFSYNNVGEIYRLKGNFERALEYYHKAVTINKKINNQANLMINYDNIGNIWLQLENYDSAGFYLNQSLEISQRLDLPKLKVTAMNSLADYHLRKGNFEASLHFYQEAYNSASSLYDLYNKRTSALGLSKLYAEVQDFRQAYLYQSNFKMLNDSITRMETAQKIARIVLALEFANQKKLLEAHRKQTGLKYFIIAAALLSLVLLSWLLYGRQKIRIKYARLEKSQIELEKEMLQEDLERKNRELTTHIMYIVRKNELIEHLGQKLLKTRKYFKKENQNRINEVIIRMQKGTSDNLWQQFGNQFNEVHQGFFSTLSEKFPALTEKDIKMCALLRLNLTTKEISSITHQSVNSIQVARTRLRKKLNIDNTELNLVKFLTSL